MAEAFLDPGVNLQGGESAYGPSVGQGTTPVQGVPFVRPYDVAAPTPGYRTLEISAGWVPVDVYEPTVIRPLRTLSSATASKYLNLYIWPETSPQVLHVPLGIPCAHCRALLTPGRWYAALDGDGSPGAVLFALIAAPTPLLQEQLLKPQPLRTNFYNNVLASGVESTIYDSDDYLLQTGLWVENNGSNGISLNFGGDAATAATGINLPTKAANPDRSALWFPYERLICGSLRAFSNLGSTLSTFLWLDG